MSSATFNVDDTQIQLLRASVACLFALTILLRFVFSTTTTLNHLIFHLVSQNPVILLSGAWCLVLSVFLYLSRRRHPVLLVDYACFKPDFDRKCSYQAGQYFVRRSRRFTTSSEEFMQGIYLKSGLGDETYGPPFIFQVDYEARLKSAVQEAQEGIFSAVDSLLQTTKIDPSQIDILIATCGMFSPTPSLSSMIVNHYKLKPEVQTFNLGGMGCSSRVMSIDMAAKLLSRDRRIRYALVVITESISLNWYFGENRSTLVTNYIFRVGTAAVLMTNDPARLSTAKMEFLTSLRTHHGANDASYKAAFQEEDADGNMGVALTKDLILVAAEGLRTHIRSLAPRLLLLSQLFAYSYSVISSKLSGGETKPKVPDFTTAFDHICVHTGGKAVIEQVGKVLHLSDEVTEPARMTLHRFGNTSSSLVFYELAYFEAKERVEKGDRMWMLAFGTGFKVCSLVWKAPRDSSREAENPWNNCIHRYPLKAW